jgi:hemin uptake protein HemP
MDRDSDPGKQPQPSTPMRASAGIGTPKLIRLDSRELFAQAREVEINHGGRIYRLRITQQNKLILTA